MKYGVFTWSEADGFKITGHDSERLQTFIADAVKQRRLFKGYWNERTWLGFTTLSRMVTEYLKHFIAKGCCSWDVIVAKCLSITLVAALGARAGDVSRSNGYHNDEFLQWGHIRLYVDAESDVANFHDLRAVVTLKFMKGAKDTHGEDSVYYLRPLDDADSHVCPIVWLLIHALRNGLVLAKTLPDVLNQALSRPDHAVEWTNPCYPVLSSFARDRPRRCDLVKPASPYQLSGTIREMGLISNILSRVYTHAMRSGAIRDIAHLPKTNESFGVTTDEHRQFLHHSRQTMNDGITERYVGEHTRELFNERAANQAKRHRREPAFSSESATDIVKAPVSKQEVQEWREANEGRQVRTAVIYRDIRQHRLNTFRKTAAPEDRWATSSRTHRPNLVALAERSASALNAGPTVTVGPGPEIVPIDPRILDDEDILEETEVPDADLRLLESTIFREGDWPYDSTSSLLEGGADRFSLGVDEGTIAMSAMSAAGFVDRYSRINVVANQSFARAWQETSAHRDMRLHSNSMSGNSRDAPTPFMYRCQKTTGCSYETCMKLSHQKHERTCAEDLVDLQRRRKTSAFQCPYDGCGKIFGSQATLTGHVDSVHKWVPQPCEHGCDPTKTYSSKSQYKTHLESHNSRWPSPCRYPGCADNATKAYTATGLRYHLKAIHGLTDLDQQREYLPPNNPHQIWVPQTCKKDACRQKTKVWAKKDYLVQHLVNAHRIRREEAKAFVKETAETKTVVNEILPKRKRDDKE
jgi:hypothetical protein